MHRSIRSGTTVVVLTVALLSLGACSKHEEPAPVAALPPSPPPPPPPPPAPSADDQLHGHLAELGAMPSDGGWSVTLSSGKFHAGKVAFSPDEQSQVDKIASLLKENPQIRVQVENYLDKRGPKAHLRELSQMQANAVLRELTSRGADEGRIQAQGMVDTSKASRTEIVFSNAAGEFRPAPLENS